MSEIFDIPDDKPKKEKKQMSPEAKTALLERLRAGRERAKLKREEQAKLKKEEPVVETPVVETPVVETPVVEVKADTEPETTDDNNLDDDDVRVLASQIEELENQVNEKKKRNYKKRDGVMVNKAKQKREQYINDMVERKISERMSKMNAPKPVVAKQQVQAPVPAPVPTPVPVPVKKVSKFAGKIKPLWARGLDL